MTESDSPGSSQSEHGELREALLRAEKAGGRTGEAAVAVMNVLFPHMLMEERYVVPLLQLLPLLARGEVTPDMRSILPRVDRLKAEMPRMLEEHRLIVLALRDFMRAATEEKLSEYVQIASKIIAHAQHEEEVLYPAAILVGEYVGLRLGRE